MLVVMAVLVGGDRGCLWLVGWLDGVEFGVGVLVCWCVCCGWHVSK